MVVSFSGLCSLSTEGGWNVGIDGGCELCSVGINGFSEFSYGDVRQGRWADFVDVTACLGFTGGVSFVGCCSGRFAKSNGDAARDFDKLTFGSVLLRNATIWVFVSSIICIRLEICCCSLSNCDSAMEAFGS
jgi:hypothetical protein